MDINILINKLEEFNKKLKSDNLIDLNNLNNQIVNFLREYKSISRDYKFKSLYKEIRLLLTKICKKKLHLEYLKKNINYVSTNNDDYYEDNNSSSYIEGSNYVIYGSNLDPLEPDQDLLDFIN